MIKSQDLQVVRYIGQLTLSIFKSYIHNKDTQIITNNTKFIKDLKQCVHNNLPGLFRFPISVGSVTVSNELYDRSNTHLKWERHKTCKWWDIHQLSLSSFKSYIHDKDIRIIIQNEKFIKELIQCVHNNLIIWVIFIISVGSLTVSWL